MKIINGVYKKDILEYEVELNEDVNEFDISAWALETKKAVDAYFTSLGLDAANYPTKIKIGDAEPLGNGVEVLQKDSGEHVSAHVKVSNDYTRIPVYLMVPNFVKTTKLYEARIAKNFDGFLENYTSPDGKWRTKLCRLHDYDAVFLEDVERGLFYPIINNMRAKLGRSWLHDNRLHIQSCYVQYGPTWKHTPKDIYIYYIYDPVLKEIKKISKEESKRLKEETKRLVTYETSSTPNEILVRIK